MPTSTPMAPGPAIIRVRDSDGQLRFEVRDDGGGFTPAATVKGGGLTNMRDRIAALGAR